MFCEKCRTQLHDDAQFCRSCGESTEPAVAPASAAPPLPPAAPAPLPYIPPYIPPPKTQLQQKQIGMVVALGVAMLASIIIELIGIVLFNILEGIAPIAPFIILYLFVLIAAVTLCAITKKWKVLWPTIVFAVVSWIQVINTFVISRMLQALAADFRLSPLTALNMSFAIRIAVTLLQLACIVLAIVLLVRDFKQSNKLNMLEENRYEHTYPE